MFTPRYLPFTLAVLAFLLTACPSNEPELGAPSTEAAPAAQPQVAELLSSVHMADPRAAAQLLDGFYGLEQGAWRWTARRFAVALKPPPPLPDQPVRLELRMTLPDVVIDRVKTLTISATANKIALGSETYDQAGEFVFSKAVPAEAVAAEVVKVEFELDQVFSAGEGDERELGLVAVSVALK